MTCALIEIVDTVQKKCKLQKVVTQKCVSKKGDEVRKNTSGACVFSLHLHCTVHSAQNLEDSIAQDISISITVQQQRTNKIIIAKGNIHKSTKLSTRQSQQRIAEIHKPNLKGDVRCLI